MRPKIVIAENVIGLVKGKARGFVNQIIKDFKALGYDVQIFQLDAAFMDVPSKRERVFFIANRLNLPPLVLDFNLPPVKFAEVRSEEGVPLKTGARLAELFAQSRPSDRSLADVNKRLRGKFTHFNDSVVADTRICPTIVASGTLLRQCDGQKFSDSDIITCQTFPQDFDFCGRSVQYICGMSVPPNMMAHIAAEVWRQWLKK